MNVENDAIGYLTVIVRTVNGALPVENAQVVIYGYGNDDNIPSNGDIIYTLSTDISGKTEKVALNSKNKDISLAPKNEVPSKGYNISVTANGYYDSSYINVPIYQGVHSLQYVNLIPLSEYSAPTDPVPNLGRIYNESTDS
ncbi:MAG: hypothetical protein IJ004_02435 [Clostridia bacterium]|nr:hypothetical protein [Clostridia bacterium]